MSPLSFIEKKEFSRKNEKKTFKIFQVFFIIIQLKLYYLGIVNTYSWLKHLYLCCDEVTYSKKFKYGAIFRFKKLLLELIIFNFTYYDILFLKKMKYILFNRHIFGILIFFYLKIYLKEYFYFIFMIIIQVFL